MEGDLASAVVLDQNPTISVVALRFMPPRESTTTTTLLRLGNLPTRTKEIYSTIPKRPATFRNAPTIALIGANPRLVATWTASGTTAMLTLTMEPT